MVKKIKLIGTTLIITIFLAAIVALALVSSHSVESVKKVSIIPQGVNGAVLSWKSDEKLDGYNIYYCKANETEEWEKIQLVDGKTDYYEFDNLEECNNYKFYINGIKYYNEQVYESKEHSKVQLFVPPVKQEIVAAYSPDKGCIKLCWVANPNATGYQINYSVNEDMSNPTRIEISDSTVDNYSISDLEVGTTFYCTVNSVAQNGKSVVAGEISDIKSVTVADKAIMSSDIDPNKPMIALTFDDGPSYTGVTTKILDLIEYYNIRATFFMIGENAKGNKNNVKRMVDLSCELGNHTWNHTKYGPKVVPSDISSCSNAIYEITGSYPTAFRSTGGNTTDTIRQECYNEGMPLYYWSVDTQDWKNRDANTTYYNVINNVKDGDIVLMHDIYPSTAQAVEWLIPELINRGYQLVTVSELITAKTGAPPQAGQQYLSAFEIKNNTR